MTTDPQERINAFWNNVAPQYAAQPRHGMLDPRETQAWIDTLRPLLPPPPADVLDVGTGPGIMARIYAQMGHRVRGVDLAPAMIEEARRQNADLSPPPVFELGDAKDPPGAPDSVDVLTSRHVFWTLIDPEQALRNWYALLRPRGRVVIIDSLWFQTEDRDAQSERQQEFERYYSDEVRARLRVMQAKSIDEIVSLVQSAGYVDVRASGLEAVEALENELHGPREDVWPRYVIVGFKPE